jgi:hypothetical protein
MRKVLLLACCLLNGCSIWTRKRAAMTPNVPLTGCTRIVHTTFNAAPNWRQRASNRSRGKSDARLDQTAMKNGRGLISG